MQEDLEQDIAKLLTEWPHGVGSNVRRVTSRNGREKIQIRVCIDSFHGLLQFECDGRPDGKQQHGRDFYLDHLEEKRRLLLTSGATPAVFRLTHRQCQKLFEESSMVYHRYVLLLQLGDYSRVIRDTTRNMRLFKFVQDHAQDAADRSHLLCWRPYVLRIHFTAAAMQHLSEGRLENALEALHACGKRLDELDEMDNDTFRQELARSREALEQMEKEIRQRKPLTEREKLEQQLSKAIDSQRYEDAARLRDQLRNFKDQNELPRIEKLPQETRPNSTPEKRDAREDDGAEFA